MGDKSYIKCALLLVFCVTWGCLNAQITIPFANQQPQWIFPLYFEDYNGDKDTLYFAYDSTATDVVSYPSDTFDLRFGEQHFVRGTSRFTAGFDGVGDSILKVIAATGITGSIIELHRVRFPFTIKWLDTLFYDSIPPSPNLSPYPSLMAELWCVDIDAPLYDNCPDNFPLCIVADDPLIYCNGAKPNVMDSLLFEGDTNFVGIYGFDFRIVPYASWIGVAEPPKSDLPSVFPNPFNDVIQINYGTVGPFYYQIFSSVGTELIQGGSSEGRTSINVRHLPAGMYFIRAWKSSQCNYQKIIKL